jgi:CubicO group peptidase (beta-lactamase class C family)
MHTSGLGYGPANADLALPEPGSGNRGFTTDRYESLEALVDELAGAPLRFHPGTHWLYSFGTDVCARLVEIISGMRFDEYLRQEVFDPLGMVDTGFVVGDDDVERFAVGYGRNSKKQLVVIDDPDESPYRKPRSLLSGGGGLVGTTADYFRFCQMLLGGGVLDGVRILAPRTVELMTINHLPGTGSWPTSPDPAPTARPGFAGMGFGLTMAVSRGPAETGVSGSPGEFMWGGAASTTFWVAPLDDLVVVFMTQLIPSAPSTSGAS